MSWAEAGGRRGWGKGGFGWSFGEGIMTRFVLEYFILQKYWVLSSELYFLRGVDGVRGNGDCEERGGVVVRRKGKETKRGKQNRGGRTWRKF